MLFKVDENLHEPEPVELYTWLVQSTAKPKEVIMSTNVELIDPEQVARIRPRFARLSAEWKEKSRYLSNTAQMAMLPSYQRIVGMGWPVVPLILESLQREPDHWFWALEAITEQNPVPPALEGHVAEMAACWIGWGREQGLLVP